MRKTKFTKLVVAGLCVLFLAACSGLGSKLSEDFDETAVKDYAKQVITLINNNDSEGIIKMSTAQLEEALTKETLEEVYEAIAKGGAFKEFSEISVAGHTDSTSKEEFAIAVVNTKYEEKNSPILSPSQKIWSWQDFFINSM